jgi:Putative lumazine-binding
MSTDIAQIEQKIDGYVRGCRTGDETYLKAAFHPDARMFGAVGEDRYDVPIFGGMSTAVSQQPTVDHQADIEVIEITGDAAYVKLIESGFWGQDFVDYFLLSRIDGEWQIVAKSFAHLGPTA